jgi:hypothetical protein
LDIIAGIAGPRYVGDSAGLKTFKNPVLTISDLHFAHFSDIVMRHRIFLWKKPCVLLQMFKIELRMLCSE